MSNLQSLMTQVQQCTLCKQVLPLPPRPILSANEQAKILIAGQAPGLVTHQTHQPFMDKSGERLRDWMGISEAQFYREKDIAILPMAFCYPGKSKTGDLPPPKICAQTWRHALLSELPNIQLTLLIGKYAIDDYVANSNLAFENTTLTHRVKNWQNLPSNVIPLPHPSPRNNIWLKKNPWFSTDLLPHLKRKVRAILP